MLKTIKTVTLSSEILFIINVSVNSSSIQPAVAALSSRGWGISNFTLPGVRYLPSPGPYLSF